MFRFTQKTVLITGAASGIGKAAAIRFAEEGANVVAVDLREDTLRLALEAIPDDRLLIYIADVGDPDAAKGAIAAAVVRFGTLDVLVNNAAYAIGGDIEATSADDFERTMRVNIGGYFYFAKAAMPELRKTKGSIVMTCSVSGLGGDMNLVAYDTSKGAVSNMVRALALDAGAHGVRVNAVNPTFTQTGMTTGLSEEVLTRVKENIPMRRLGQPEDVASVMLFLASEDAGFVTGVNLPVDGGVSASNGQPAL